MKIKDYIQAKGFQQNKGKVHLLMDGAMGSLLQDYNLAEEDFRGTLFAESKVQLKGNNDVLSLTRPDVISDIHRRYLEAGADLIITNTFSSQRISQQEYMLCDYVEEMNAAAVRIARAEADRMSELTPQQPRFVLGDVGPTSRMLSMSDDVNDPAARSITFDELESAYAQQISALVRGGVDAIIIETIFDTLNAKAAISAYQRVLELEQRSCDDIPLMVSMTISDASGRTLSGQTIEAFVVSIAHAHPLSVGMNCGLGAEGMLPYLRRMRKFVRNSLISCHPNAGLPNQFGAYDDTPSDMVRQMLPMISEKIADIIGGCCGTTPEHIRAMRQMLDESGINLSEGERKITGTAEISSFSSDISSDSSYTCSDSLDTCYDSLDSFSESSDKSSVSSVVSSESGCDDALLRRSTYAGLEAFAYGPDDFVVTGERCNVAGSRKFLRLINEKKYDEALDIARTQVERGAMVVDVNMDDGLLDAESEMRIFLNLLASDPAICRVPIMIDSSRFEVIETGLKCCQGKCIVNSISLKQGEAEFIQHAQVCKRLGAAVIVMCFDERGQATDYARRIEICERAYRLLTEKVGMDPRDIIFDPNVLTIATGMAEHADYARDFIRATEWITSHLPGARVSGGLSNLSFAFRGNNYVREAMHSVFLHHAKAVGMSMAIMNPATAVRYESIEENLRTAISDVILNKVGDGEDPSAPTERLMALAQEILERQLAEKEAKKATVSNSSATVSNSSATVSNNSAVVSSNSVEFSLQQALIKGIATTLEADLRLLLSEGRTPLQIISGPLMEGMNEVGRLFGEGRMFLPQVVKTARTMKKAVGILLDTPSAIADEEGKSCESGDDLKLREEKDAISSAGTILLATVKGDVHDIGKNIVGVVLGCNGFRVIDLGVMVPPEEIVDEAVRRKVDIVCLSGLITPSLSEMCTVASMMQQRGLTIPLFVGGATTSEVHTAVKIAPLYGGGVFHLRDASQNPVLAMQLLDPLQREEVLLRNRTRQQRVRLVQQRKEQRLAVRRATSEALGEPSAVERRFSCEWANYEPVRPPFVGRRVHAPLSISHLLPLIDWNFFFWAWRVKADSDEGRLLRHDADELLAELAADANYDVRAVTAFYPAQGKSDGIEVHLRHSDHDPHCPCCNASVTIVTPRQSVVSSSGDTRQQCLSLCDFVSPLGNDFVGAFATTMSRAFVERLERMKADASDDYALLLLQTIGDRLAEAAAESLSRELAEDYHWHGIRPAVGYPSLPEQKAIFSLDPMLYYADFGITLTENGAMSPQSSVSGLYISHPDATYF